MERAVTVSDAMAVEIRRIRPADVAALERFYDGLSPDSRRLRFLTLGAAVSDAASRRFCTPDHHHREGFVAVDAATPGRPVVGHLCLEPDGAGRAEVAIAVADAWQHRHVGRRLMEAGIAWARHEGIAHLTATMLAENTGIVHLLEGLGCRSHLASEPDDLASLVISLDIPGAAAA